ncbi:PH, RCC1 and FYVE domains-containing protein 1 [Gastrolobium bilobum]|uniref:PH, RCC1 and FYVE domains-containing protein 1 n=1 Tax=Gastrolobium bilobum TaxID=150636 RepID=UPI002AB08484|nr:PH, RCC1 and FYVE domains-containing protein 1 [Gastrolobium bilobum]
MTMGEESLTQVPFDRTVEQAIVSIKKGAYLLKSGRRGKPKLCPFRLSPDERNLIWYSGQQEKHLRLSAVTKIIQGQGNIRSQKQNEPEKECHSFSLIYANGERSIDLICKDKAQAATWLVGLRAVISRCQHPRALSSLRSCKGVQSCVSSPAGILRRKKNLGLLDDTSQFTQVHSVCASPSLSLSERCFSDGLSCTSDNFCSSASFPSSINGIIDNSVPSSPYIDPDIVSKIESTHIDKEYKKDLSCRSLMPPTSPRVGNNNVLKDVMVWGGGIGCLVGIVNERFVQRGVYSLVPKLLESTMMLDVQNIALGGKHAALVTKQGEVFCWGQGKWGRLGQKIDMDISSPKIVESLNGIQIKQVACGEYHTCGLSDSGEVYTWGNDVCCADFVDEGRIRSQWIPHKLSGPLDGISISSVTCGEWHTAIVSSCGRLFTYGDGTFGVLGHGDVRSSSKPKEVESLKGLRVRSVACGSWHTAAIVDVMCDRYRYSTTSGKLFTWGDGDEGRLGHADNGSKLVPTCVSQLVDYDFVQVSCGRMLTVALTTMGKVFAMGSAKYGQLGNPHARDKAAVMVEGQLKQEFVKAISCGSYHVAVLTSTRSVYTWGKGENGQLGLGDTEDRYTPSFVETLRDRQVDTITCGPSFTAAVCLHKPISISDQSTCSGCRLPFGFTRKKHHCYNCGLLFCRSCSSKKVINASLAPSKSKAFRVCDQCFDKRQGSTHSVMGSKSKSYNTQQIVKHQKKISDLTEDRGETTVTQGPLLSLSQSCYRKSMPSGRKDWKNQQESQHGLEDSSSMLGGVPQWGQVPCPALFKINCTENSVVHTDTTKSDKMLLEEVMRLRAEARRLEEQCELKNHKIQECQQKVEESWFVAREEAAKCKAAKEVIKALALRLHTISGKENAGQEGKVGIHESLPNLAPIHTDINSPRDGNMDSLSNSPIVFSDTLKSKFGRSMLLKSDRLLENSNATRSESQQETNEGLKAECVEQYEPGVYITFTTLPCGKKGLKRVRFSRRRFSQKEAERWWEENQGTVYHKYEIEGYINTSQSQALDEKLASRKMKAVRLDGEEEFIDSQIIVMLGWNRAGKTTIIRMLDDLLKPNTIEGRSNVEMSEFNVSYKPHTISPKFQSTILLIERLMDQEVVNLSGGVLERVALCLYLGKHIGISGKKEQGFDREKHERKLGFEPLFPAISMKMAGIAPQDRKKGQKPL